MRNPQRMALLLFALFFIALAARADDSIDPATQAQFQNAILRAYNDPRVAQAIAEAQTRHESVDVSFDDQSYALKGTTEVMVAPAQPPKESITHLGAMIDVGVPDGAGVNIVYRPWKWLRVFAGGTYNGAGPGIRGGATLTLPWYFPILPSLTVEGGHAFEGDANWIAQKVSGDPSFENASLKRVSYDYASGLVGLELGAPNRFTFYIQGGMSYIHSTIHDFQQTTNQSNVTFKDPNVNMLVPTGKLGFMVYFW